MSTEIDAEARQVAVVPDSGTADHQFVEETGKKLFQTSCQPCRWDVRQAALRDPAAGPRSVRENVSFDHDNVAIEVGQYPCRQ
ncbi:hypothetical protein [Mycobacterium sp. 1245801.1]|uniref:hypothetical protein n=1 Tax=Mycobacterium sp. 1245801.1 TaxID=1834075 RepID=UPI0012E9DB47|nr:hypothetical protein [Mycobacterium sp. 1245801.1]